MKTILLAVILIANGAALVFGIQAYFLYRRSGTPVPWTFVGGVMSQVGVLLMLLASSGRFDEGVATVLRIFGALLITWWAVIVFRARRRARLQAKEDSLGGASEDERQLPTGGKH